MAITRLQVRFHQPTLLLGTHSFSLDHITLKLLSFLPHKHFFLVSSILFSYFAFNGDNTSNVCAQWLPLLCDDTCKGLNYERCPEKFMKTSLLRSKEWQFDMAPCLHDRSCTLQQTTQSWRCRRGHVSLLSAARLIRGEKIVAMKKCLSFFCLKNTATIK